MNIKNSVLISACTFLIIVGAYLSIQIGPVPVVLTNFFIILVGLILGWKRSLVVIFTYIILGAVGLPVFSNGKAGLAHLLGLTGGFVFAFIPLAFLSGLVSQKGIIIKFIVIIFASILVYVIGVPWAMNIYNTVIAPNADKTLWDLSTTLKYTAIPFLIPDLIKVVVAIILSEILKPTLKQFINNNEK